MRGPGDGGQQRRRGERTGLFIRRQQDAIADIGGFGLEPETGECAQHDTEPTFHVGNARAMQCAIGTPRYGAKQRVLGIDRVVMASQRDLQRSLRPHRQQQGLAARLEFFLTAASDLHDRRKRLALHRARQKRQFRLQQGRQLGEASQIAASTVDGAPADRPPTSRSARASMSASMALIARDINIECGVFCFHDPHNACCCRFWPTTGAAMPSTSYIFCDVIIQNH